jgi:hypothetical protein
MKKLLLIFLPLLFFSCEIIKDYQVSSNTSIPRNLISEISVQSKLYYQTKGEWPGDLELLERAGVLDVDRSIKLMWTFDFQLPDKISAISTEEMKLGAGYEIVYDVVDDKFRVNKLKDGEKGEINESRLTVKQYIKNESSSVDICECLVNSFYYNSNEQSCDKAINKELGHNWKTTNYSQEPYKSAKFDALANRCM